MGGVGESIGAVLFCLLGGFMNSTWPLFCKFESPRLIRVATPDGWQWENVWLPFTLWVCVLNIILCVWVIGPSTLSTIYRNASTTDLTLVCVFSFLWGLGTMCFSLGIQLLGAGPGIALVMSLLVVIGTLLPLIEDHADDAASPAALVTILGLVFAICGFVATAKSSGIKERALSSQVTGSSGESNLEVELSPSHSEAAATEASGRSAVVVLSASVGTAARSDTEGGPGSATRSVMHTKGALSATQQDISKKEDGARGGTSHLAAVAVCAIGAVMSSMLQFSFVYGEPLITSAEDDEGVSGVAAPLVVWLLAFSLSGLWNVGYACVLLFKNDTWGRYRWMSADEFCGAALKMTAMSVFFIGHIHLYGVAQFLFGNLGPVIAWPLLMSSTVLSGQLWSIFMKEWVGAPKLSVHVSILAISLLGLAVTIIAIAGAVL